MTADGVGHDYRVLESTEHYLGPVFRVVSDLVTMPRGGSAIRDTVVHPEAVAVVAREPAGRIALIRQYRHAIRRREWELPAGLRDDPGEAPEAVARRELLEEVGLVAGDVRPLAVVHPAPGYSDELVRLFVTTVECDEDGQPRIERAYAAEPQDDEELEITWSWVTVQAGLGMIGRGEITNSICQIGLLAVAAF